MEKIMLLIKTNEEDIDAIVDPDEIVIACVYISDASKCLEVFPTFKKKIKGMLPKPLYEHIKLRYVRSTPSILSMYNFNIKKGCNKVISLLFKDLGNTELNKLFTSEWNDDVLLAIFGTFKEYFNAGFYKLLKTQNNLLIIVRAFIDNFVCYYIEEIIHCVRSLNRKTLKSSSTPLTTYVFEYLEIAQKLLVYKEKVNPNAQNAENNEQQNQNDNIQNEEVVGGVKDLDKIAAAKKEKNFKKYKFPVKKFNKEVTNRDNMKILPIKPLSQMDKAKNLIHIIEQNSNRQIQPIQLAGVRNSMARGQYAQHPTLTLHLYQETAQHSQDNGNGKLQYSLQHLR